MTLTAKNHKSGKVVGGYRLIIGYLGIFLIVTGIAMLLPLLTLFAFPEEGAYAHYFYIPGLASVAVGVGLFLSIFRHEKGRLGKHQDSVLLVLIWLISILVSSIPFLLRGGMSFTDSIFETTSAYSSTGFTLFDFSSDIAPKCYIVYRSVLIFLGGIGLVLVVTSAISDRYGLKLYTAEGHNDKLMPNLAKSARLILGIYTGYIILGGLGLWLIGGMNLFDSFNHSTACLATGGFSSRAGGFYEIMTADYAAGITNEIGLHVNPLGIEIVSSILMLLGGTNFLIHMFIFSAKFKKIGKDCEFRFMVIMFIIFIPIFFAAVYFSNLESYTPLQSFRYGTYVFISSITTSGFANFPSIPSLGPVTLTLIIIMTIIGGGMGSTSGGVKQYRLIVALKSFYWSIKEKGASRRKIFPHNIARLGEIKEVSSEEITDSYNYIFLYVLIVVVASLMQVLIANGQGLMLNGHPITFADTMFEFANGISSCGLSNGLSALRDPWINWITIIGMFLGRLEIYAVQLAINRGIRDIARKETY